MSNLRLNYSSFDWQSIKDDELWNFRINNFKIHIAVIQYFRMNELIDYISHITNKTLSVIIIGIADKFKIIIVIGDKKYWTDNVSPTVHTILSTTLHTKLTLQYTLNKYYTTLHYTCITLQTTLHSTQYNTIHSTLHYTVQYTLYTTRYTLHMGIPTNWSL